MKSSVFYICIKIEALWTTYGLKLGSMRLWSLGSAGNQVPQDLSIDPYIFVYADIAIYNCYD